MRFNAKDYLKKKYISGEWAIIPITLNSKDEFYNKYDATHCTISSDLCRYIDSSVYNIPLKYKIKLRIDCPDLTEEDKREMEEAVRTHYGLIVYDNECDLATNAYKTSELLILGLIVLAVLFLYEGYMNSYLEEVIAIAGWFAVWEAVDNFVYDRKEFKTNRKNNLQMLDSKLEFVCREEQKYSETKF